MTEKTKKKDFVEISYTGYVNDNVFDSNVEEDLKKLNPEAKPKKTVVVIGERMVVPGLDEELEDKEVGKECEITVKPNEGFGLRDRKLIRTIPLSAFTSQKINPEVGMTLALDNNLVKIIAISGARVIADFNNPLAGKELQYRFKIIRILKEEKEKVESLLEFYFNSVPEYEINDKVAVRGERNIEAFVSLYKARFKELTGKELVFEEKKAENKKGEKLEEKLEEEDKKPESRKEDKPGKNEEPQN